jgi:hypothetical protein
MPKYGGRDFQPGPDPRRNPGGRPRTRAWTEAYNKLSTMPIGEVVKISRSRTLPSLLVKAAQAFLKTGSQAAFLREVTDRQQGKEPQAVELGGTEGEKLVDEGKIADRIAALMAKAKGRK